MIFTVGNSQLPDPLGAGPAIKHRQHIQAHTAHNQAHTSRIKQNQAHASPQSSRYSTQSSTYSHQLSQWDASLAKGIVTQISIMEGRTGIPVPCKRCQASRECYHQCKEQSCVRRMSGAQGCVLVLKPHHPPSTLYRRTRNGLYYSSSVVWENLQYNCRRVILVVCTNHRAKKDGEKME